MNEKIKELKEQARDSINQLNDYNLKYDPDDYRSAVEEKFAELIVLECAEFVSNDRMNDEYGQFIANRIKEHFGVE